MGKLTGTKHGDAATELMGFYRDKANELEESGQYFMAAIALAFATEAAILAYFLVELTEENEDDEFAVPDDAHFVDLIEAAKEVDVLNAPIDIPSHVGENKGKAPPRHVAKDVVDKIRKFRNLIHPARALKESYDPRTFTKEQLAEFWDMYESVVHSLIYYI